MQGKFVNLAWGADGAFALNALTFLISALFILLMHFREPAQHHAERRPILSDLREGWTAVARIPILRFLCGALFLDASTAVGLTVLLLPLLTGPWQSSESLLGSLMTCVGLGTLVGTLPALWLLGRYPPLPLAALATAGIIATMGIIGTTPSLAVAGVALFANGFLATCVELVALTTTQRAVPREQLGRAVGLLFWVLALGQVYGALGGSLLLRYTTPMIAAVILSGGGVVLLALVLLGSIGAVRAAEAPTPGE